MSTEKEPELQQTIVTKEYQQLPIITDRRYAELAFVFLFACYSAALLTQLLSFVPLALPIVERFPAIFAGLSLIVLSICQLRKLPEPRVLLFGLFLGTLVGL